MTRVKTKCPVIRAEKCLAFEAKESQMANKSIFGTSTRNKKGPATDTVNEAGGKAYAFGPEHALAQLAATGCLNATFYATAEQQLDTVLDLAKKVSPKYLAQVALFARERGYMKDMPALLLAILAHRDVSLMKKVFDRVVDNGKMLRNFVQIIRSDKVGRKSLGTAPKAMIADWLNSRDDKRLLEASVGNDPSLADVIKLTHPKPKNAARNAFYGYLLGKEHDARKLPAIVKEFEAYKKGDSKIVPDVPFQLLTALPLGKKEWTEIAKDMKWHATRMNLNTLKRHGVFEDPKMVKMVAERLSDEEQIQKARVFPYQLLVAYLHTADLPFEIREALQDAMEKATDNIPEIDGKVFVFPDVSGSMNAPVTGFREGATTVVSCRQLAALVSASIVRKNKTAEIIPFSDHAVSFRFNPRDSVMTITEQISKLPSGGTNCSAPMRELNNRGAEADLIVYVSDNQSWVDNSCGGMGTETMREFELLKKRSPKCKLVLLDGCPNTNTQGKERKDILNIGGFSDSCFEIISEFAAGKLGSDHWVGEIERVSI